MLQIPTSQANLSSDTHEIPPTVWKPKFCFLILRSLPLFPVRSYTNQVHTPTLFFNVSNFIIVFTPASFKVSVSFRLSNQSHTQWNSSWSTKNQTFPLWMWVALSTSVLRFMAVAQWYKRYQDIYRVIQEGRSLLWEVVVGKKNSYKHVSSSEWLPSWSCWIRRVPFFLPNFFFF
jgi:hypothetical protein